MNKFDDGGEFPMVGADAPQGAGNQQYQQRPYAFAASFDDIVADALHQADIRVQLLDDEAIDCGKVAGYQLADRLHDLGTRLRDAAGILGRRGGAVKARRPLPWRARARHWRTPNALAAGSRYPV